MSQVIKKKRELKVRSIFNEDSNPEKNAPEQSVTPLIAEQEQQAHVLESTEQISQPIPVSPEYVPLVQESAIVFKQQIPEPVPVNKNNTVQSIEKFESVPKIETPKQVQTNPENTKLSKIEELKLKYLKKNPQPTQQTPKEEPIRVAQIKKENPVQEIPKKAVTISSAVPEVIPHVQKSEESQGKNVGLGDSHLTGSYKTNFTPMIEEKIKAKVPAPPPVKRPPPPVRNPFELKGTYPQHVKTEPIAPITPITPIAQVAPQIVQIDPPQQHISKPIQQTINQPSLHPTHDSSFRSPQPQYDRNPAQPIKLNYSNIKYQKVFIEQLLKNNILSPFIGQLFLQRFFVPSDSTRNLEIQVNTTHPQFNPWVSKLFTNFLLKSPSISEDNYPLADEILNEFFLPLGNNFSQAFILVLAKLNQQYYSKYQQYLASNPHLYVEMIASHHAIISKDKAGEFLLYIQSFLNQSQQRVSETLILMFLTSSQTINEQALNLFIRKAQFQEAVVVFYLLQRHKSKFVRQNVEIANIIINRLEQNNERETALELIKNLIEELGTTAYGLLKDKREKLLRGYSEVSGTSDNTLKQAKNVASNLFGFFSNAMDKIINKQPDQAPPPKIEKPAESKDSIYFDPVKKRYVLNGEIPDDGEQEQEVEVKKQAPPPLPQVRTAPPPPTPVPSASSTAASKRQNRMPVNRYV